MTPVTLEAPVAPPPSAPSAPAEALPPAVVSPILEPTPSAAPVVAPSLGAPILEARDLTKRYRLGGRDVDAVRGISLTVRQGEFVAIMGPSGSGKSTLLQILGGLDRPTSGDVVLDGETITALSDEAATRLRRARTGFVFQFFNLIPLLTVEENVGLPFTIAGVDPRGGEIARRISDVLAVVDLTGKERN